MMLRLARPSIELVPQIQDFWSEFNVINEPVWPSYSAKEGESAEAFVARMVEREHNPEPGFVPESIYWAMVGDDLIGRISLRHRLEGKLLIYGGHIGYEVRPAFRRRGYATEMLRLLLQTPKAQEIKKLLLTCSPDNVASNKTITANGGQFAQKVYVDFLGEDRNHYWITLG